MGFHWIFGHLRLKNWAGMDNLIDHHKLWSTKSKITKEKNGENIPYLEITEVVLTYCNVVNNSYQQNSRYLYPFISSKSFGQLLDISPENLIFLKTFDSEFSDIGLSFTDQNSNLLEIEDKINITLLIN